MSVHLTPTELAEEMHMKRRDVLRKCIEMNVPVPEWVDLLAKLADDLEKDVTEPS